jgi:group I intron endonuclease
MIIYKATNKLNKKVYIGQTIQKLNQRIKGHKHAALKTKKIGLFNNAIRKYGIENFEWKIVCECYLFEDLQIAEKVFISYYNSNSRGIGYNNTDGGNNGLHSEETKKLLSAQRKGRKLKDEWKKNVVAAQLKTIHKRFPPLNENLVISMYKECLSTEKEREKIAENAYKRIVKSFSNQKLLTDAYKAIEKDRKPLYGNVSRKYLEQKPIYLDKTDLKKGYEHVKKKISNYKYVSFKNKGYEILPYRDYVQVYSMELIGKPISVCDLLLSSKVIGDYASLSLYYAYNYLQNKDSYLKENLDVSQLMVRKDYLLNNFDKFKQLYKNGFNIQKEFTSFVSIPLIKTNKIKKIPVVGTDHILFGLFEMNLVNLRNQKKLFTDSYLYKLAFYSIFVNPQILKYILVNSIKRTKNKKWIKISDHILRFLFKKN